MRKKIFSALVAGIMLISSCTQANPPKEDPVDSRGSAKILDGKTVVVSIFANDHVCEWDFTNETDIESRKTAKKHLKIALDYITTESQKWGKNAEFIYDWEIDPDLYGERNIPYEACNDELYTTRSTQKILEHTFDSDALLERYDADNIFFIFYFNTPLWHEHSPYALNTLVYDSHYYEYCAMNIAFEGTLTSPTEYAHEILHLFGVLDYYKPDSNFDISDDFVEYCAENHPQEIMFVTNDNYGKFAYDSISAEINEITAYYIGWTDYSDEQSRFGLYTSEHVPDVIEE